LLGRDVIGAAQTGTGKTAIDSSVRLGIDSIEHGTYADDESFRLMKEHGTYLVPTIYVARLLSELSAASPPKKVALIHPKATMANPSRWLRSRLERLKPRISKRPLRAVPAMERRNPLACGSP
jgi:hypothetical protein